MARTYIAGINDALAKVGSKYRSPEDDFTDPPAMRREEVSQPAPPPVVVNVQNAAPTAPASTPAAPVQPSPAVPPQVVQDPAVASPVEHPSTVVEGPAEAPHVPDIGVDDLHGKSIKDLRYAPVNEAQGTSDRIGQSGDIDVGMHRDAASAAQKKSDYAATHRQALEGFFNESHAHEGQQMSRARQLTNDMFDANRKGPPPPSTMQKVLGIIAAVSSMGNGPNAGAAQGMGMLSGLMGNDLQKWQAQQASNANTLGAMHGQMGAEQSSRSGHYADAAHLMLLHGAEIDNALEASKELNLGKKADIARQQLQQDWRDKMSTSLAAMKTADAKTGLATRGKAADTELYQRLAEAEGNQAEQVRLASLHPAGGKRGHDVLQDYLKSRGTMVQHNQQEANAEHARVATQVALEKASRDASAVKGPKTEYENKVHGYMRSMAGPQGAIATIEKYTHDAAGNELTDRDVDLPYAGAATRGGQSWLPALLTPEDNLKYDQAINTAKMNYVRMRSGAGIKETEAEDELRALGVYSRDEAVAARGVKALVGALRSNDNFGALHNPGAFNAPAQQPAAQGTPQAARGPMNRVGSVPPSPGVPAVVNGVQGTVGATRPSASRWPLQ